MAESAQAQDIIAGRKVFFITPDVSLIPKSFCEEYLAEGYECYFVENDKKIPLAKKIDIIVSLFKDVILFFNVDADIPGISWPVFVSSIHQRYDGQIPIGCLFAKRQAKNEKLKIERKYLYDLDLICGCIQLEYRKNLNFAIIEKVLYAFQATGRRKNVRAIGNEYCTFAFKYKGTAFSGTLQDISLSHFTIVLPPDSNFSLKEYEKIDGINFVVRGCHFTSSAILFMERTTEQGNRLFVFMFVNNTGKTGLDMALRQRFAPVFYQLMSENCNNLLEGLYKTYLDKKAAGEITDDEIVGDVTALLEEVEDEVPAAGQGDGDDGVKYAND